MNVIHQLWDRHWPLILILAALVMVFIWAVALLHPDKLTDGVYTCDLPGNCYLDYHTPAVALACPDVDYIRLWPVEQPWQETPDPEGLPDGYVRR